MEESLGHTCRVMTVSRSDFLNAYYRELTALREEGAAFAQDYPTVAARLKMDDSETADPHVERMLESFAFLAARLQLNIDTVAGQVTDALLDVLYPHLIRPLPAMTVAQFQTSPERNAPPNEGFALPRHTEVFAYASDNSLCKFSTVYPLTLLPITLEDATVVSLGAYQRVPVPDTIEFDYRRYRDSPPYFLELTLRSPVAFQELVLNELSFYLNIPDSVFKKQLYRAIFSAEALVYAARGDSATALPLLPGTLTPLGFERDEMAIPPSPHEVHAYQLLQEFFHFREKFMFFKLKKLDFLSYLRRGTFLQTDCLKLLVPLRNASSEWARKIAAGDILMNATPLVNLYQATTDPISWDRKSTFYHLSPNAQKDRTMEIYQINDVFAIPSDTGQEVRVQPYFSLEREGRLLNEAEDDGSGEVRRATARPTDNLFWWSKTEPTYHKNLVGIDSWITFVDANSNWIDPTPYIFYAKALCTNRFLAEDMPQGAVLQTDRALPVERIVTLSKPVAPQYILERGANNARLVAQLSTNYLGFPYDDNRQDGSDLAENLRNVLTLHMGPSNREAGEVLIGALERVTAQRSAKRLGREAWRGFAEGVVLTLTVKNQTDDWFLLAQILHRYFAMNCQINTFVDLVFKENQDTILKFESVFGEQRTI